MEGKPGSGFGRENGDTVELLDAHSAFIATVVKRSHAVTGKQAGHDMAQGQAVSKWCDTIKQPDTIATDPVSGRHQHGVLLQIACFRLQAHPGPGKVEHGFVLLRSQNELTMLDGG